VPSHGHSLLIPVFLLNLSNGSRPRNTRAQRPLQRRQDRAISHGIARETRVSGAQERLLPNKRHVDTFESATDAIVELADDDVRLEEARSRVKRRSRLSRLSRLSRGIDNKQQKPPMGSESRPHPVRRDSFSRESRMCPPNALPRDRARRRMKAARSSEAREWRRNAKRAVVFTWGQQGPSAGPTGAY